MEDQTQSDWLIDQLYDDLGTGIFLSKFEGIKNFQPEVTYNYCQDLAKMLDALAYKWVPVNIVKNYKDLLNKPCNMTCNGSCIEYGCICHPEKNICV